jgi:hypothetical protein
MAEAPLDNAASFVQQLDKLQAEIQARQPGYEYSLREIHKALNDDPALLHIIKPDQIGIVVAGLKLKQNEVIVEETLKSKRGAGGKKLRDLTEDDI